jgi:ABC-2 type transport system permease protein
MWFRNVYLKTLRDYRVAIFGWGIGLGLLMYVVLIAINDVVGTPEARAALLSLAASFSWMAEPIKIDTPGGYATWKYGFTILVMALWPILVASRMLRGDEERGILDSLLALPKSRGQVALQKVAAMWTALLGMAVLIGLLTYAGGASVKADFGLGDSLLFGLNLALICGVFGSLTLLISQFTQDARPAAGIAGGVLLVSIMVDMIHRVVPGTDWLSRLSPVYYYNLSKPLIPSYGTDPVALGVMALLSVVFSAAAIWLFVRRDIGRPVTLPGRLSRPERAVPPERALPVNDWSLRSVYLRSLASIAVSTAWWTLAIAGFAAFMIFVAQQTLQQLQELMAGSSLLQNVITNVGGGGQADLSDAILSFFFVFLPVLLMAFAVTQASRWAGDDEDGLNDLVLAAPQSRLNVILARFGALTTATVVIGVVTLVACGAASAASGLAVNGNNLAAATLSMIPLGLLTAALGYLFSGWLRSAIDTGLLSFLLLIWFVITFIGPELGWSDGVLRLSALYYYGQPLINGWQVANILGVLLVAAAALALASARYMRKDVGR